MLLLECRSRECDVTNVCLANYSVRLVAPSNLFVSLIVRKGQNREYMQVAVV